MGGAYAVEKITKGNKSITVATATAGNHGRSVSWGAQKLGLNCKIFIIIENKIKLLFQKQNAEKIKSYIIIKRFLTKITQKN